MGEVLLQSETLNIPEEIARKLKGNKVEFLETKERILLKLVDDPITSARGFLKGGRFTSKRCLSLKGEEKGLER